jgi:hypothetical protein
MNNGKLTQIKTAGENKRKIIPTNEVLRFENIDINSKN